MENNKVFVKKYISKHRAGCSCNLFCKKRRIPIYLKKTVLKRTSNIIFNTKKVDLDES